MLGNKTEGSLVSLELIIKVIDTNGTILRYEDEEGKILAILEEEKVFNTEHLTITEHGILSGFMLINGKLVKRDYKEE
jgi:hypothetical protein